MSNQKTRLKICGITTLEDARYAAGALVDYLGFIFYPGSPRYITPRNASEINGWIEGPEKIGVFVNQPMDEINQVVERAGIDLIQLHGDEEPEMARQLNKPVIKVFRLKGEDDLDAIQRKLEEWKGIAAYFMFDAYDSRQYGGTGKEWNWSLVTKLKSDTPCFLAGGISADNVIAAVTEVRPFAIDLSSSLEMSPGIKDFDKIQNFMDLWNEWNEADS